MTCHMQVWPYLLGLYPVSSSREEREAILDSATQHYNKALSEWQQVEATKKEIELEAVNGHRVGSEGSRGASPALSVISNSPLQSPVRTIPRDTESHDLSCDADATGVENGLPQDEGRDQPVAATPSHEGDSDLPPSSPNGNASHDRENTSHDQDKAASRDQDNPSHDQVSSAQSPATKSSTRQQLEEMWPPTPEELVMSSQKLDSQGKVFVKELINIDKDIPRCDRDYW